MFTGGSTELMHSPSEKTKSWKIYLRILSYLKPYARQIVLVFIFNFFFVIFSTLSVWMVAPVISALFQEKPAAEKVVEKSEVTPGETEQPSLWNINAWLKANVQKWLSRGDRIETLEWLCLFIFLTFFLKNLFAFLEFYWVSYVEQKVIKDIREQLYTHVIHQPLSFFQRYKTGELISRITNDINAVNVAVNRSFTKIIRDPILILLFMAILFTISWQLTLVALLVFPISGGLIQKIGQSLKRKSRRVQERISDITAVLQEAISGIKVVKAFAMEKYEDTKFRTKTENYFRAVLRQVRLNRLSRPLSETLGVGVMAVVLWYGGRLVLQGQLLSSEDFIRFIIILFSVMDPIKSLGELNNNIQIALASGQRIFEILDTPITITSRPNAIKKTSFDHEIRYEGVTFRYSPDGEDVLKNIHLVVEKNQKIALVGSSGAGKTTLVNLLPRFYDVTEGAILIDGVDIRDISLPYLRRLMGIVTQEVILFNDTVANNIAYGMLDYSREEIERAARLANAYEFIMELPQGFDTVVGERGMRLSGGQRQRISIARAILKNPPILIFDEATSSLDSESEFLIQEAVENLMRERTVIMIAHRLSSIIHADRIIVLEEGSIVDEGSHEELLSRSERYRYLYELQFTT
ncbi:MAG: ABC transporter ATP-binding protein [Calditrichaeota bacterium]|nr:MAG: ABC transporter ATP-binding protein [Calditrichota bacterium]